MRGQKGRSPTQYIRFLSYLLVQVEHDSRKLFPPRVLGGDSFEGRYLFVGKHVVGGRGNRVVYRLPGVAQSGEETVKTKGGVKNKV